MTRKEVIVRAIAKELTWIQAAEICGITARHMRRLKGYYERHGYGGLVDGRRGGLPRRPQAFCHDHQKVRNLPTRFGEEAEIIVTRDSVPVARLLPYRPKAAARRARFDTASHKRWLRRFWKGQDTRDSTDALLERDRAE